MANRYWVGGTGTWNASNTANWSTTSGGAGGASVPVAADYAVFNASSGGGTVTIAYTPAVFGFQVSGYAGTIDFNGYVVQMGGNGGTLFAQDTATSWAGDPIIELTYSGGTGTRTLSAVTGANEAKAVTFKILAGTDIIATGSNRSFKTLDFTGFSGTLTNTTRNIYGSLTVSTGMTLTAGTNATTFGSTTGTNTITSNGKTLDFPLTFNGVGGTWQCADALTLGSTRALTLTNGTLKLKNGVTSTVGSFATSGTNLKYLTSSVAGSQATLSDASGINSVAYLSIKDINATGGATWDAYISNNNVDSGNNTGWDFNALAIKKILRKVFSRQIIRPVIEEV